MKIPFMVTICVDYSDVLGLTLPYNRHHFNRVLVVTSHRDTETQSVARKFDCDVFSTDAFYRDGAHFNKWLALEEGLSTVERSDLMAILDADVAWPKELPSSFLPEVGKLYTPRRRMRREISGPIPPEKTWQRHRLHGNDKEWSGYTWIFYAEDPALAWRPWFQADWTHAGGGDTFFQQRWPREHRERPPFEVLHIGEDGTNWCGRVSAFADGSTPKDGHKRLSALRELMSKRRLGRPDAFKHERLK